MYQQRGPSPRNRGHSSHGCGLRAARGTKSQSPGSRHRLRRTSTARVTAPSASYACVAWRERFRRTRALVVLASAPQVGQVGPSEQPRFSSSRTGSGLADAGTPRSAPRSVAKTQASAARDRREGWPRAALRHGLQRRCRAPRWAFGGQCSVFRRPSVPSGWRIRPPALRAVFRW